MSEERNYWLTVGKIVAPQGLEGAIRINPMSDFPERFVNPGDRWLQKDNEKPRKVKLLNGRKMPGKALYIVSFSEIKNRSQAELLVGLNLLVPSYDRPLLGKEEFHMLDLLGLQVRLDNNVIGKITNLTRAGNDLLEIELIEGKKVLIPFVKEIVPKVDTKNGFIVLSPPKGLLEI